MSIRIQWLPYETDYGSTPLTHSPLCRFNSTHNNTTRLHTIYSNCLVLPTRLSRLLCIALVNRSVPIATDTSDSHTPLLSSPTHLHLVDCFFPLCATPHDEPHWPCRPSRSSIVPHSIFSSYRTLHWPCLSLRLHPPLLPPSARRVCCRPPVRPLICCTTCRDYSTADWTSRRSPYCADCVSAACNRKRSPLW